MTTIVKTAWGVDVPEQARPAPTPRSRSGKRKMQRLFRTAAADAAQVVIDVLNDRAAPSKLRIDAAKIILDYGVGKATPMTKETREEKEGFSAQGLPTVAEITTPDFTGSQWEIEHGQIEGNI